MQKKIETMVLGIGELSLDAISTWFPSKNKETIAKAIETSEVIGIKGNKVMAKSKMDAIEKESVTKKKINLAKIPEKLEAKEIQENEIKKEYTEEINYGELLELIMKYNRRVKEQYEKLIARNFDNMKEAIIKYYEAKFEVVKNPFKVSGKSEMYSLVHKKTKFEVAYLYVGEFLSEEDFNKISSNFVEDTVYFCITKDAEVLPNVSDREYYLKDVDDIVNKYLNQYKFKEIDTTILKIN